MTKSLSVEKKSGWWQICATIYFYCLSFLIVKSRWNPQSRQQDRNECHSEKKDFPRKRKALADDVSLLPKILTIFTWFWIEKCNCLSHTYISRDTRLYIVNNIFE